MARYEQILNKISPIFYKLLPARELTYHYKLLTAYLTAKHLPEIIEFDVDDLRNIFYLIWIRRLELPENNRRLSFQLVTLLTKNYVKGGYVFVDVLITDIILNKFIFENEIIREAIPPITFGDYVKAFIGKDTYNAIRNYIR